MEDSEKRNKDLKIVRLSRFCCHSVRQERESDQALEPKAAGVEAQPP